MLSEEIEQAVQKYVSEKHIFKRFLNQVRDYFQLDPELNNENFPIIHSMKFRLKDPEHLKEKLIRKSKDDRIITADNLFKEITDLAGIRILHLYMEQFHKIHEKLMMQIQSDEWAFVEKPKAYTWDPEIEKLLKEYDISCSRKESFYTSVHYLVKPNNNNSNVVCEVQVRTLFEEIWGEIDHNLNYPHPTSSIACREQLKVLTRLVSTGTRLADSIFNSYEEYNSNVSK